MLLLLLLGATQPPGRGGRTEVRGTVATTGWRATRAAAGTGTEATGSTGAGAAVSAARSPWTGTTETTAAAETAGTAGTWPAEAAARWPRRTIFAIRR
mgnify:CR=1 FL=1